MTLPAIKQLKGNNPSCSITYAIDRRDKFDTYYELVQGLDFIDHVVDARFLIQDDYDQVIDLTSSCIVYERPGFQPINRIDLFASALGVDLLDGVPVYQATDAEKVWAQQMLTGLEDKQLVFLHTASEDERRCWPSEYCVGLIEAFQANHNVHFLVMDYDKKLNAKLGSNCTDVSQTSVREMAALIEASTLFVGPDSGPMHLAGALKVPSIVLFGSVPPEARLSYYKTHRALVSKTVNCLGCWWSQCDNEFQCMKTITVDEVMVMMNQYLSEIKQELS